MTVTNGVATKSVEPLEHLLDQVNNPETAAALTQVLKSAPLLALLLSALEGAIQRSEIITDNIGESLREIRVSGSNGKSVDFAAVAAQLSSVVPQVAETLPQLVPQIPHLVQVGTKLGEVTDSPEFDALLSSGMFAPRTVNLLGEIGDTLAETHKNFQDNPRQIGLVGLLTSLRDPDVQRALGFSIELLKGIGQMLAKNA